MNKSALRLLLLSLSEYSLYVPTINTVIIVTVIKSSLLIIYHNGSMCKQQIVPQHEKGKKIVCNQTICKFFEVEDRLCRQ